MNAREDYPIRRLTFSTTMGTVESVPTCPGYGAAMDEIDRLRAENTELRTNENRRIRAAVLAYSEIREALPEPDELPAVRADLLVLRTALVKWRRDQRRNGAHFWRCDGDLLVLVPDDCWGLTP